MLSMVMRGYKLGRHKLRGKRMRILYNNYMMNLYSIYFLPRF